MTNNRTDLEALAVRVEAAEAADRELDFLIAEADGYRDIHGDRSLWDRGNDGYWMPDNNDSPGMSELPHFTASIDAALQLVPEGWVWTINSFPDKANAYCVNDQHEIARPREQYQATPALALCAAALRARASA